MEWLDRNYGLQLLREKEIINNEWEETEDFEDFGAVATMSVESLMDSIKHDTAVLFFVANRKQKKILRDMIFSFDSYVGDLVSQCDVDGWIDVAQTRLMNACKEYWSAQIYDKLLKKIQP